MIVLVFMNYLNGLAVSDVGELKEGAQIRNQILRIDIIYHMEKLFLHPIVREIMDWFKAKPSKIFLIPEFQQKKLTYLEELRCPVNQPLSKGQCHWFCSAT